MESILLILGALVVLSILVVVHEFGHYVAARLMGVWVEEFGVGLPPRARGKKFGDTIYSLNWLPLGGFVRLHGESGDTKITRPKEAFVNKPKWARVFIALAGIFMNFWFAWICFTLMFLVTGIPKGVSVEEVAEGSPAEIAGIAAGDTIWRINGREVVGADEFLFTIRASTGQDIAVTTTREIDGELVTGEHTISVREVAEEGEGLTGITYGFLPAAVERPSIVAAPVVYPYYGGRETIKWTNFTIDAIVSLFSELGSGRVPQGLAGPFGVTLTIAEIIRYGAAAVLSFTAIISINLALVNVIPFPPLDGSRVVLLGIEGLVGQKRLQRVEGKVLTAGMVVLLLLIALLTLSEIPKLWSAGSISGFVDSLFVQ